MARGKRGKSTGRGPLGQPKPPPAITTMGDKEAMGDELLIPAIAEYDKRTEEILAMPRDHMAGQVETACLGELCLIRECLMALVAVNKQAGDLVAQRLAEQAERLQELRAPLDRIKELERQIKEQDREAHERRMKRSRPVASSGDIMNSPEEEIDYNGDLSEEADGI